MISKVFSVLCIFFLGFAHAAANEYSLLARYSSGSKFSAFDEMSDRMHSAFDAHVKRSTEKLSSNPTLRTSTSYSYFLMQEWSDNKCSAVDKAWLVVYANVCYPLVNSTNFVKFTLTSDGTLFVATPYAFSDSSCTGAGSVQPVGAGSIGCDTTSGVQYSVSNTLPVPEDGALREE
jgi:hypothetical protein